MVLGHKMDRTKPLYNIQLNTSYQLSVELCAYKTLEREQCSFGIVQNF